MNHAQRSALEMFVDRFEDFHEWPATRQVDYLALFLTSEGGQESVTGNQITACFQDLSLKEYKRVRSYLSENAARRNGKYVKVAAGGYRLTRSTFREIEKEINQEPAKSDVSGRLLGLVTEVQDKQSRIFLDEAVNCYRVGAYRAFIVMVWLVSIDHLQKFIYSEALNEFNAAIGRHRDKRLRTVSKYDDFSDIPEVRFIELARSAGVVSNDVRKILDEKLGIRNTAAHPSSVGVSGHKATEFALDLVENVLLKY